MEIFFVWIIIGVVIYLLNQSNEPTREEQIQANKELINKLRLQIQVKDEIPPKDKNLPNEKYIAVKVKGLFGHPEENKTKVFLTIHDNTDISDDEFGAPVLSAHTIICRA